MTKADLIKQFFTEHPDGTRKQAAEYAGCTVQRVGEVVRAGLPEPVTVGTVSPDGTMSIDGAALHELAAGAWARHPNNSFRETRTTACEHERRSKKRRGTCAVCPPFVG